MIDLPLPTTPIWAATTLASADGAAYRVAVAIILAFWRGGCRPLPTDDTVLMALARCSATTWYRVRDRVKAALAEIVPQLAEDHTRMLRARQARQAVARLAGIASAQKRREAKRSVGGQSMFASPSMMAPQAQHPTPYRNPSADLPKLAEVAMRRCSAQTRAGCCRPAC